jgi:hypothetical protein
VWICHLEAKGVGIGMVSNEVPIVNDLLQSPGSTMNSISDHKEERNCSIAFEYLENCRCCFWVRAIIEGE